MVGVLSAAILGRNGGTQVRAGRQARDGIEEELQ